MSCYNCICPGCVLNCELDPQFFTLGEFPPDAEACFNCDDCIEYTGTKQKRLWREDCENYIEARKYSEYRASQMRKKWRVIKPGKE